MRLSKSCKMWCFLLRPLSGSLVDCYDELGIRYQLPPYVLSAPINLIDEGSDVDCGGAAADPPPSRSRGIELPIRLQLSNGKDLRLTVRSTDTMLQLKRHLQAAEGIPSGHLRFYFAGRQLMDRSRIKDAKIRKNYTIQAIVTESPEETTPAQQPPPLPPPAVAPDMDTGGHDSW